MKNILVIDDDLHIGNVLEETLTNEGYGVIRAYSGTEAVLLLSQVKPDLVLLDLMLPGLSGEEVLPHIKGIPVIIMSAKVDVDKVKIDENTIAVISTVTANNKTIFMSISKKPRRGIPMQRYGIKNAIHITTLTKEHVIKFDK